MFAIDIISETLKKSCCWGSGAEDLLSLSKKFATANLTPQQVIAHPLKLAVVKPHFGEPPRRKGTVSQDS